MAKADQEAQLRYKKNISDLLAEKTLTSGSRTNVIFNRTDPGHYVAASCEDIDPVVLHAPTRKSVPFFGAVHPSDGLLVTQRTDKFNAETFQRFL